MSEYEQGFQAWCDGYCRSENPYKYDTNAHRRWENGWLDADYEDYCSCCDVD